jgi:hypothetical protein
MSLKGIVVLLNPSHCFLSRLQGEHFFSTTHTCKDMLLLYWSQRKGQLSQNTSLLFISWLPQLFVIAAESWLTQCFILFYYWCAGWGYIVTFIKDLTIYHTWIDPLYHSSLSPLLPIPRISILFLQWLLHFSKLIAIFILLHVHISTEPDK